MKTAALQLPFAERSELAKSLLLSMEQPSQEELEALWEVEINRRIQAVVNGEIELISGEDAFARARAVLT